MSKVNLQACFERVARTGLSAAKAEDVASLAHALWHEGFSPNFKNLSGQGVLDAGYLVDFLSRFDTLPREKRVAMHKLATSYRPPVFVMKASKGVDSLARAWGASSDLSRFMKDLLPMQTRHYKSAVEKRVSMVA